MNIQTRSIEVFEYAKLLLILSLLMLSSSIAMAADSREAEIKTVKVNDYEFSYVERGKGAPLILVHGALTDYRTWLPLMNELSETNRTIAVSLRHYYPEQWNGEGDDFSLQQHANDISEFVKSLNLGKVDLLGHSRGAVVAMMVASQHPELVNNLVLADPSPLQTMLQNTPKAKKLMDLRKATIQKTVNYYREGQPERGLEYFVNYIAGPDAWKKTSDKRRATLRDNSWTQVGHLQDLEAPFQCSQAENINSRVLMITGERSAPLYGYMLSALKPCFKQVSNALIADAGHMMYSANPTAFVFEVQDFIAP